MTPSPSNPSSFLRITAAPHGFSDGNLSARCDGETFRIGSAAWSTSMARRAVAAGGMSIGAHRVAATPPLRRAA